LSWSTTNTATVQIYANTTSTGDRRTRIKISSIGARSAIASAGIIILTGLHRLDHGDGKNVDLPERSRARLDTEQVRYLSREERLQYLVKINDKGLLVWAKNGELVWTKDELFRDSVNGIVPIDDAAPKWKYNVRPPGEDSSTSSSSEDSGQEQELDNTEGDEGERYVNEEVRNL
jgi:hypothetical protein